MATRYYGVKRLLGKAERIGPATEKMVFVRNDEVLVGIVTGSKYAIAADLTDRKEYAAFYHACQKGEWVDLELYRLPREEAENCPDEGRVTVKELNALLKRPVSKRSTKKIK
jgi:hypothetical protein